MNKTPFLLLAALVASGILLISSSVQAASGTWNVDADGNWGTASNWTPVAVPGSTAGDVVNLTYDITGNRVVTMAGVNRTVGILNIGDASNSYTLAQTGGATLILNSGTTSPAQINMAANSAANVISTNLGLATSVNIINSGTANASTLTLSGDISSFAASGTQVMSISNAAGNGMTISGVISDGGFGGAVGVLINSSKGVSLTGTSNSYTGGTVIQAGSLGFSGNSLGAGPVTLGNASSGATSITLGGGGTMNQNLIVSSLATGNIRLQSNGTSTGNIDLQRKLTLYMVSGTPHIELTGNISGAGSLDIGNGGSVAGAQVTLSGSNTFSGGVIFTFSNNRLNINNAAALGTGTLTITTLGGTGTRLDNTSGAAITNIKNNVIALNGDFSFIGSNALNLGTGAVTMNGDRIITVSSSTLTFGGAISGASRSLTKSGTGTLQLNGANAYTGATTVTAGTLVINGSTNASSAVGVDAGAVLSGTGTVNGALTVNGKLAPGNSPGNLTVANNVSMLNGSTMSMEITGATFGSQYDRVTMTGVSSTFSLTGTNNLELSLTYTPAASELFFLVDNQSSNAIAGIFEELNGITTTLTQGSMFTVGATTFSISYTADVSGNTFLGGNDLAIQVVPEPGAAAMLLTGVGMFLLLKPRRRKG